MKVYLAASSEELDRVEAVASELTDAGIVIVQDWWNEVRERGTGNPSDFESRVLLSSRDVAAIAKCDVFLVLTGPSFGGGFELREAMVQNKLTLAVGRKSIFAVRADQEYGTDADAVLALVTMSKEVQF